MRIAYVCTDPGIPVWGAKGASIHVQEMLRAFLNRGADVILLTPRAEGTPPADLTDVTVLPLPPATKGDAEARARILLSTNDNVGAVLDRLQPDLVYERHALYAHAAMEWAAGQGCACVLEVNAPLVAEQMAYRQLALPDAAEASVRRTMRAAKLVSAVTEPVARHVRAMGARSAIVVPNAVNPTRFPPPGARPSRSFTVGFLGSLKPWHGLPTLVDAFAHLRRSMPDARLLIVGDGPERTEIEARLDASGLSGAAEITGLLPANRVPAALARMDVGTAPYQAMPDFYFSPLKIYEYMAAAIPVLTSRTGDLDRIVTHERTGLLVPPGDSAALGKALARLAADLPASRDMGAAARAHVLANHTWDATADRVLSSALTSGDRSA